MIILCFGGWCFLRILCRCEVDLICFVIMVIFAERKTEEQENISKLKPGTRVIKRRPGECRQGGRGVFFGPLRREQNKILDGSVVRVLPMLLD